MIIILSLLFNYLTDPFELIKTCKTVRQYSRKYKITFKSYKKFDKQIITKFRFKKIIVNDNYNNNNWKDKDLKYLTGIHTLNLGYDINITDEGLKSLVGIHTLNLWDNTNITDDGLKYIKGCIFTNNKLGYCNDIVQIN